MILKRGFYQTEYGNTVYVSGPKAKTAYDVDSAERIPICMVTMFIRSLERGEHVNTSDRY